MSRALNEQLTRDGPPPSPAEPGYAEWLRAQLEQAMVDLAEPGRVEIEHGAIFVELDSVVDKYEKR